MQGEEKQVEHTAKLQERGMNLSKIHLPALAVMRKVAKENVKVIDPYATISDLILWQKIGRKIASTYLVDEQDMNDKQIKQVIYQLKTNTLQLKGQSKALNELLQQVLLVLLKKTFGQPCQKTFTVRNKRVIIQSIKRETGPFHTLMIGKCKPSSQATYYPFLYEAIKDEQLIGLIQEIIHCQRTTNKQLFFTHDLTSFLEAYSKVQLDQWMKQYGEAIIYKRYGNEFFIGIKEDALSGQDIYQDLLAFTKIYNIRLIKCHYQKASKEIYFLAYALFQKKDKAYLHCVMAEQSIINFIKAHDYGVWQTYRARSRPYLVNLPLEKIIQTYNRELLAFARIYPDAHNFHRFRAVIYLARKSLLYTLAQKHKSTAKKIKSQLQDKVNGRQTIKAEKGKQIISLLTYEQLRKLSNIN